MILVLVQPTSSSSHGQAAYAAHRHIGAFAESSRASRSHAAWFRESGAGARETRPAGSVHTAGRIPGYETDRLPRTYRWTYYCHGSVPPRPWATISLAQREVDNAAVPLAQLARASDQYELVDDHRPRNGTLRSLVCLHLRGTVGFTLQSCWMATVHLRREQGFN